MSKHNMLLLVLLLLVGCQVRPPAGAPVSGNAVHATQPPLTPIDDLGVTGRPVEVDIQTYRLEVDGLVDHPLSLSYQDLLSLPTVTQVPRLDCPGFFVDYAQWTGPLVRTILEKAGVQSEAQTVVFYDGGDVPYRATLTLEEALRDDTYLAHTLYGEPLPPTHGYPIRLVAGSKLGSAWVKWLFRIGVS